MEEAAKDPADTDNRDLLLSFLRKALKADPEFAAEVARLLTAAVAATQNPQGKRAGPQPTGYP